MDAGVTLMVVDFLRKLVGRSNNVWDAQSPANYLEGVGVAEALDYDDIIARLQVAKNEIDRIKSQLMNEINDYHDRLIDAIRNNDKDAMEEAAAEIVLKKKVLRGVLAYGKLINMAIHRINDARSIEAIARSLASLEYALVGMSDYMNALSPDVTAKLVSVIESAERVIRGTNVMASNLPRPVNPLEMDPEIREEIARAMKEAQIESEDLLKIPPTIRTRSLEEELLDYIKKNNGVVNIRKASQELGVTAEDIKKALFNLYRKGVIKISTSRESEAI